MTWRRKLAFSAFTVALLFAAIEGSARLIWWWLEQRSFARQESAGHEILQNDAISFMKEADGMYGYVLKPNFQRGSIRINDAGFHQNYDVPVERITGRLRVVCLGESTTFGNDAESNYPAHLRRILNANGTPADVINAGVPGWVSDQIALRAEHQLAAYKPDIVILYVGWNDFQSYDPLGPEPPVSYWEFAYKGRAWKQQATTWLRSVALLSAAYHSERDSPETVHRSGSQAGAGGHYRFLLQNLDRITAAFRAANPDVKMFVSTLAGRWPVGTPEDWKRIPSVWWMEKHEVSPLRAASYVSAMNEQLRQFARSRETYTIDIAAGFEPLDRAKLMSDWAHMTSDGYELIAWTMYDALAAAGVARSSGEPSRVRQLRSQYSLTAPDALPAVRTGTSG